MTKKKGSKKGDGLQKDPTAHKTRSELVTHYAAQIFSIPYMEHNRLTHFWTLYFVLLLDMLLLVLILAHDLSLEALPYFKLSLEARYNNVVMMARSLNFGAFGYVLGGDDECGFPSVRYDYSDLAGCSSPPMMRTCKGYHLDASESSLFADICSTCGLSLPLAFNYTIAHACCTLLMWKFISRRTDKRIDSQLNKQLSALVSTFAVYTGLEAQNFTAKCGSAISSFSIPAFSSHSSSSSLSYCAEVMGFSVTMSVITLVVVITTPSVPPKERKSAKAEALSFKQLAKSGGKLFENVKSSKDALSKKSAEAYKKRSLSRSRASARSNNSGSKPYEFTEVKAFSFD
ncbi:hypothetical protein TrRE_jg3894 [Triparma retinervis]|uniref:Uncharacterized protein n=1 Tax=Triparma retinervis TaxID=2557542 RepID=A0A9W6ZVE2_9STRA|nr:hypothetical protein TrRE_jg3894 [Triparma retinervis]